MPFVEHIRATARFSLGPAATPKEEASCTLAFRPGANLDTGDRLALANDMLADWRTYLSNSGSKVTDSVQVDQVRVYKIGTDGKMVGAPTYSSGVAGRGVTSSNKHPWQCSVVLTLVAGAAGKGRLGRIYLPPMGFAVDVNGAIDDSAHGDMVTATATLMSALSNKPGFDVGFGLAVAGGTGAAGTLRDVVALRLGRVCDTQRRRRRSLDEAYVAVPFTA